MEITLQEIHIGHEMSEGIEAVKDAQAFLKRAKADLTISDVPKKTLEWFKSFSEDEFSCKNGKGHYGFALKYLCDFHQGLIQNGHEMAEAKADEALIQLAELKSQPEEKKRKTIRMVNGKELEV